MDEPWLYHNDKATINGVAGQWLTLPQKILSAKIPLEIFSPRFFGIKMASSSLSSKGPNHQHGVLPISAGAIEGHFEGKTQATGRSPRASCSCAITPRLTRHLQPRRNWPTWASNALITHPILQSWPCQTTTCSLD